MAKSISNTRWLSELEAAIPVAIEGKDPEGVHEIRVATRRLMTWLDLGGRRIGRDDLGWLRNENARIRDLDVQLACDVPGEMRQWLQAEWEAARPALLQVLRHRRTFSLIEMCRHMPAVSRSDADAGLARLVERALKAANKVVEGATEADDLHRVRRRIRPIRYALEWMGRSDKGIKKAQDRLGELNDAETTLLMARSWGGSAAHIRQLEEARNALLEPAVASMPTIVRALERLR